MRASEAQRKHTEKGKQLLDNMIVKQEHLESLIASTPAGVAALENGLPPVVVYGSPEEAAVHAFLAAREALDEHNAIQLDPVRNYRVLSIDGTEKYGEFRCDYVLAPLTSGKLMLEKQINRYALEEQLPDGQWVAYYPQHEKRAQSS